MNASEATGGRRNLVAEGVIGLAICLALHFFLAEPLQRRLDDRNAEIERLVAARHETGSLLERMPDVMRSLERQAASAQRVHDRGAVVNDEGAMFTAIMELADTSGVRVEQMEPRAGVTPARPTNAPTPPAPRPGDRSLSYTINARGTYADVCAFVGALQNDLAYTLISAVRLAPSVAGQQDEVLAVIETSHFCVDVTPPAAGTLAGVSQEGGGP